MDAMKSYGLLLLLFGWIVPAVIVGLTTSRMQELRNDDCRLLEAPAQDELRERRQRSEEVARRIVHKEEEGADLRGPPTRRLGPGA